MVSSTLKKIIQPLLGITAISIFLFSLMNLPYIEQVLGIEKPQETPVAVENNEEVKESSISEEVEKSVEEKREEKSTTPPPMQPNRLSIPALGIEAPIRQPTGQTEELYQECLQKGVCRYPNTANVGSVGNAYIFGHSSDYAWKKGDYKAVFAKLPGIQKGEKIIVSDSEGKVYTYKVIEGRVVSPKDASVISQETKGKKILSLQTSYPIGTALKRYLVVSELAE